MKALLVLSFILAGSLSFGDINSDFNYAGAVRAFKAAAGNVPSESQLSGTWVSVGFAGPQHSKSRYAADGWFAYDEGKGAFREFRDYKPTAVDPYGVQYYASAETVVDQASGKGSKYGDDLKWSAGDGLTSILFAPGKRGATLVCGLSEECRLLSTNGMLLCFTKQTGKWPCTSFKDVNWYQGFVRAQR